VLELGYESDSFAKNSYYTHLAVAYGLRSVQLKRLQSLMRWLGTQAAK